MRLSVVLLVALPGCVASDPAPPEGPLPVDPTIALDACTNVSGAFTVPESAAKAFLPPGFEPRTTGDTPIDGAILWVVAARCESARVDGTDLGEASVAYAELDVRPPAEFRAGIDDFTLPVFLVATPEPLAKAFEALAFGGAGGGEVAWTFDAARPSVAAERNGTGFRFSAALSPAGGATPEGSFRVFGVADRKVSRVVEGTYSAGTGSGGAVNLEPLGEPPLVSQARPVARGGSIAGFSLGFHAAPG